MPALSVALAVVGSAVPAWARRLPEAELIDPGTVETALNQLLARTGAPFLLPVQADDQLQPDAIFRLAHELQAAGRRRPCAAGVTDQVRRDGARRRVQAAPLTEWRSVLTALRLPTPILFRTGALRAVGGWRQGEACWEHRSQRHRGLLARLLAGGGALLASGEYLGTAARVSSNCPPAAAPTLEGALKHLLFRPITLEGPGFQVSGRLAALTPSLATLVQENAPITLIPVSKITAVAAGRHDRLP